MSATDSDELFGVSISRGSRKYPLVDQVCEILRREIRKGRWRVGERLPSLASLSQEAGLSNWPLQRAFEMLQEEGYIISQEKVGYFLHSMNPTGEPLEGEEGQSALIGKVVGIAIRKADLSSVWSVELPDRLPVLHEAAEKRGYSIEAKYLSEKDDWARVTKIGEIFGRDVLGVISLYPFPHADEEDLALTPDKLPFVYYGSSTSTCLPVVCGDTHNGFFRLTKRVISLGHRKIIMLGEPDQSLREVENRYLGYARAMEQSGLRPNREAHLESLSLRAGDLKALEEFLERHSEVTAIISARTVITQDVIAMAELMGRRVPEDLSVVGHGPPLMRPHDTENRLVSLGYDYRYLTNQCLDVLEYQALTRQCGVLRFMGMPRITDGHSLAPLSADEDAVLLGAEAAE